MLQMSGEYTLFFRTRMTHFYNGSIMLNTGFAINYRTNVCNFLFGHGLGFSGKHFLHFLQ